MLNDEMIPCKSDEYIYGAITTFLFCSKENKYTYKYILGCGYTAQSNMNRHYRRKHRGISKEQIRHIKMMVRACQKRNIFNNFILLHKCRCQRKYVMYRTCKMLLEMCAIVYFIFVSL